MTLDTEQHVSPHILLDGREDGISTFSKRVINGHVRVCLHKLAIQHIPYTWLKAQWVNNFLSLLLYLLYIPLPSKNLCEYSFYYHFPKTTIFIVYQPGS